MTRPNFRYERRLWRKGYKIVAGADEVGRGAWSGPVVAAACAFAPMTNDKFQMPNGIEIDDSKKLTTRQRERAEKWIKENALAWGIGEAGAGVINRVAMARASKIAFRRAIAACNRRLQQKKKAVDSRLWAVDFLLIDAFYLPYTKGLRRKNQLAIIDGDEKSFSIASASILAKVYRDKLMRRLSRKHPKYGWGRNKGYGTREHQEAIRKYGITRLHRKEFVRNAIR